MEEIAARNLTGAASLKAALAVCALAASALLMAAFVFSRAQIGADSAALAHIDLPLTGGRVQSVQATGPRGRPIHLTIRQGRLWPTSALSPGETVSVAIVVRRSGWIAWLAGKTDRVSVRLRTPNARLASPYLLLPKGEPLRLEFTQPVRTIAYGNGSSLRRHALTGASSTVTLARPTEAGTLRVAVASRSWEQLSAPQVLIWFPAGAGPSAVVSPSPASPIAPSTPISVTFSQPLSAALGQSAPHLSPAVPGRWRQTDSHTIAFTPSGEGYGFGKSVTLSLPRSIGVLDMSGSSSGLNRSSSSSLPTWTVPNGSPLRAAQILAQLGYLPLRFQAATGPPVPTMASEESAAIDPPAGSFSWRYGDVPSSLRDLWRPGAESVVMRGALMAFEEAHGLTADGVAGPAVWRALIRAAIDDHRTGAGYSYVTVSERSQKLVLWHDGRNVFTTPVNTGIASAPTARGTFPVFEHISSGTMSGTNPDGSHYNDPGVPWISYFNGGDALHGFYRAQYGFPQSLGCVEMPVPAAGRVWPYTPVGTLVHVE
jgi:peptidoglycan hydrolase-like protein with peptidoglycan-binding domain